MTMELLIEILMLICDIVIVWYAISDHRGRKEWYCIVVGMVVAIYYNGCLEKLFAINH